jgi:hypothetical protein
MARAFIILILAVAGSGCVACSPDGSALVGHYLMTKGGFNEKLTIDLESDGSYALDHELMACVIGPSGEMVITRNREEGKWRFEHGIVVLQPSARTKGFLDQPVFAPAHTRRLAPKASLFSRSLVSADYPDHLVLTRRKTPNKAPEPTPTSVTPRATSSVFEVKQRTESRIEARVVPAVVVAVMRRL